MKGAVRHPAGHDQPHQRPRGRRGRARARRRRHGVDGAAVPRRRRLRRTRRRPAAPTRSTPASPATRPASTTSSSARSRPASSIPYACRETELRVAPRAGAASASRSSARGRRGSPRATTAAERGHDVTLFDAAAEIGGQFNLARRIPGQGGVRRDAALLPARGSSALGVEARARPRACGAADLAGFDARGLATGIVPRMPAIPGIDHPKVASYVDIVEGRRTAGAAGGDRRRRRHRLRRRRVPDAARPTARERRRIDDPAIALPRRVGHRRRATRRAAA